MNLKKTSIDAAVVIGIAILVGISMLVTISGLFTQIALVIDLLSELPVKPYLSASGEINIL